MTGIAAAGAAELDAALNRFVAQNGRPGAAAGVVHGDELVWTAGAGFADTGTRVTGDLGTLYRIASITKTFTGTAVMQLRDAGRLDLDDPAVKYLPELRGAVSPFAAIEAVTGVPAGVGRGRPVVMRAGPGPVDLFPAARLHRAGRRLTGAGGGLTAGDAQAPVPG